MTGYRCEDCPKYRECPKTIETREGPKRIEPNSTACIGIREHPDGAKIAKASIGELADMLEKKLRGR